MKLVQEIKSLRENLINQLERQESNGSEVITLTSHECENIFQLLLKAENRLLKLEAKQTGTEIKGF